MFRLLHTNFVHRYSIHNGDVAPQNFFLTLALDVVGGQRHAPRRFTYWNETRDPVYKHLSEPQCRCRRVRKFSPPTAIRSQDRPARTESLHRLRYPGPRNFIHAHKRNMAFPQSIFTKLTNSQNRSPNSPIEFHRYQTINRYVRIQFNLRIRVKDPIHVRVWLASPAGLGFQ